LNYHPDSYYARLYLGDTYKELKDYPEALVYYRKILESPSAPDREELHKVVSSLEQSRP